MPLSAATAIDNFRSRVAKASARAGMGRMGTIDVGMSFRAWCEELAKAGLKVDRKPFRLDDRPALVPVYEAIPTTAAEAHEWMLVIQKATQLGLTVWEVLADVFMAKKWGPINIGLFLPDQSMASFKSEHRFMPIVRSAPSLLRELTHRIEADGAETRLGEGNVLTRQFANSLLMFLWTTGKVTTEGRPMDVVSLDEVQEMTLSQIDKVLARVGDSLIAYKLLLSTANMPDADINAWYKRGTQEVWHTRCQTCGELSDLSEPVGIFPAKSIAYNTGQVKGGRDGVLVPHNEFVWTCPVCACHIDQPDVQLGAYVSANPTPSYKIRSLLLPRTISPRMSARLMMEGYNNARTGDQKKSFYNRTLARPYIDAEQLPVTMEACLEASREGVRMGLTWQTSGRDCYMGIDQMGGWCAIIIKRRLPDGRQAVVHVEASFGDDPFARCSELMDIFGVVVCIVEQLPNVNDARRFANKHRGRVWLAGYADLRDDMMVWGDDMSKSDRRTVEEDRSRHSVSLNQYKAMQMALYRIRDRHCLFPDWRTLEQDVFDNGEPKRLLLLRDWVFLHFTKTALVIVHPEGERKPRAKVLKIGIDPHYAFANMLCDVGWSRSHGTSTFLLPDMLVGPQKPLAIAVATLMPGLPSNILAMVDQAAAGTCGSCSSYDAGACQSRGFRVGSADPGCPLYDSRRS